MGFLFEHRNNFGHNEHRLADVGVSGPFHSHRGLGDVVQEAAHLVGDGSIVRCQLLRVLGMSPEVLADRLLQGQKAIHHLELAGPPSRRVMFRKGGGRGGWEGWGPAGQRAVVSIFDILYCYIYFLCDGNRTRPKGHQT